MIYKIKLQLLFLGIMIEFLAGLTIQAQGLQFYGNDYPIEQRTSYTVFREASSPQYTQYIDLSFDLNIQDFKSFGYLLHLTIPQSNIAYSLTYTYIDGYSSAFKFNTEGKINHISLTFINDSIKSQWLPVKLHIDLPSGKSTLKVANQMEQSKQYTPIPSPLKPILCFGRREHLLDMPSFAIRNLKVTGDGYSLSFPLNESQGKIVHDSQGRPLGEVSHPYWLINDAYHWKKNMAFYSKTPIGSNFNQEKQTIVFFNQDSLYTYRINTKELIKQEYANKMPLQILLGTNFIDETEQKIYAYEINSIPVGNTTLTALNLNTLTWEAIGTAFTPIQLHRHNSFWNSKEKSYIIFGGFGNRQYSNKFITYNQSSDRWDTLRIAGEQISPRFNSAIAASLEDNMLYIYGGIGNDSGDQSIGHNYYNDLYQIDLSKQMIKRLWSKPSKDKLVPSGQMIMSPDKKYLYVMRYPDYIRDSYLQLYRISIENGETILLGDSIPFMSGAIESSVNLYHNPVLQELYCVIHEFKHPKGVKKSIVYTLSTPPVSKISTEMHTKPSAKNNQNIQFFLFCVIIAAITTCVIFLFQWYQKKQKHSVLAAPITSELRTTLVTPLKNAHHSRTELPIASIVSETEVIYKEFNNIYIYGIFTVYGRSGRDITHLFSNKLKLIFLYILLNSTKEGVSSHLLNDLFWPDKAEDKVKNLKGVTVSNLRKILAEIDGIELIYEKGFFRIVITPPCCCDYFNMHMYLNESGKAHAELIAIWKKGRLLEGINVELFDKYKQYSEDIIFSRLAPELANYYQNKDHKEVLSICAILRKCDALYEPALIYAIYAYHCLNDYESISKLYATFVAEYRSSMAEDYPKKLDSLLQEAKSYVPED